MFAFYSLPHSANSCIGNCLIIETRDDAGVHIIRFVSAQHFGCVSVDWIGVIRVGFLRFMKTIMQNELSLSLNEQQTEKCVEQQKRFEHGTWNVLGFSRSWWDFEVMDILLTEMVW